MTFPMHWRALSPEPERVDQGDLDAALKRMDILGCYDGPAVICDCGETVIEGYEINLLELVNLVAEHQKTCTMVGH